MWNSIRRFWRSEVGDKKNADLGGPASDVLRLSDNPQLKCTPQAARPKADGGADANDYELKFS